MSTHSNLVGLDLHEAFHYVQETDPGAVGSGKYWLKASTGELKRRNSANNAWIAIGTSNVSAFTDLTDVPATYAGQGLKLVRVNAGATALEFTPPLTVPLPDWLSMHPDAPPVSPNALDDEFTGSSLDVKWTWQNQGTATATVAKSHLSMLLTATASIDFKGIFQTPPATPWTATAKITINATSILDSMKAIMALRDSSGKLIIYGFTHFASLQIFVSRFTNDTTFSANSSNISALERTAYFRITDNGTNLIFSFSYDGASFIEQFSESRTAFFASGPTQVGLGGFTQNASVPVTIGFDWFRIS